MPEICANELGYCFCNQPPDECRGIYDTPHPRFETLLPVQVFANTNERALLQQHHVNVLIDFVPIVRPIALWSDIRALWVLYWKFKKNPPLVVHSITPKAGLLSMIAAWLACIPVRVHSFTGQVWATKNGSMRLLLKAADKCIFALATEILVDSPSQRNFLIEQGVVTAERSSVLGAGSICGVNTKRFSPNETVREIVRNELETTSDAVVCLYLVDCIPIKVY